MYLQTCYVPAHVLCTCTRVMYLHTCYVPAHVCCTCTCVSAMAMRDVRKHLVRREMTYLFVQESWPGQYPLNSGFNETLELILRRYARVAQAHLPPHWKGIAEHGTPHNSVMRAACAGGAHGKAAGVFQSLASLGHALVRRQRIVTKYSETPKTCYPPSVTPKMRYQEVNGRLAR